MELRDRVILVTGGGKRLGRAIALALGEAGAWIAVHHHTSARGAQDVVRELDGRGATYAANLADCSAAANLVDRVLRERGRLDGLVLNAATFPRTPFGSVNEADWDDTFSTNLKSPFFIAQRAAPAIKRAGGAVVLLSDVSAGLPWLDYAPYCLAKAGIDGLTTILAKALAPTGRANAIAPGPVLPAAESNEADQDAIARSTLLERFGNADDVARTARFLMESDYINGEIVAVDGGQRVKRDRPQGS